MVKQIDARGKACPLPVIEAKRALEEAPGGSRIEVLVDNEIAVQNLCKMAVQKHYEASGTKIHDNCYLVEILKNGTAEEAGERRTEGIPAVRRGTSVGARQRTARLQAEPMNGTERGMVVVLSSDEMGEKDSHPGQTPDEKFHLCADRAGAAAGDDFAVQRRRLAVL